MDIAKLIIYFLYSGLSYRTFKRLKLGAQQHLESNKASASNSQRLNELKDLLTWVGCTIIIYLQEILDSILSWLPLYSFWKIIIILVIFSEKEITLKILYSLENVILRVEENVDKLIQFFTNFSANFSMPMFKILFTNSNLMIQGGNLQQLLKLEEICNEYLEKVRVAKGKDSKKIVKKLTEIRLPSPDDDVVRCRVGIMLKKILVHGEKASFFPHELRFNVNTKEVEWIPEGDDKVNKDKLKKAKPLSTVDRTLEIEMINNKKVVQFPDTATYIQWGDRLAINLTRTMTNK